MRPILALYRPYRRLLLLGLVAVLFSSGFGLTIPWILKEAIDRLQERPAGTTLLLFAAALLVFTLIQGTFRFLARRTIVGVSRQIEYDLRNQLYRQWLRLDRGFYDRVPSGDLMARATQDMSTLRTLLGAGPLHLSTTFIVGISAVALMARLNPWLTLYALAPFPVVLWTLKELRHRMEHRLHRAQARYQELCGQVQEAVAGMRLIKTYTLGEAMVGAFRDKGEEYLTEEMRVVRLEGIYYPLTSLASGIGIVFVLAIGGQQVASGQMTLGELVAFNAYLGMLMWPTIALAWLLSLWQRGKVAFDRIAETLAEEPVIREHPQPIHATSIRGGIEATDLTFRYGNGSRLAALNHLSFTIPAGAFVALVGPNGGGKSTFLSLLPRLRNVSVGQLFLDGIDLTRLPTAFLRRSVGYVPQESFLLSDTLRNNIAFGLEEPADAVIRRALFLAALEEEVAALPHGLDTVVGERGVTLSGGQRQRVTIARAVALDPQILILDDALSSVDAETERAILDRLRAHFRGRTILVSTHRLPSTQSADLILVLDGGRTVEQGSHGELLNRAGLYARLWDRYQLVES
ncbi:MAG: ABC transporter ATP-binding protein [candidate division NC10 bacterium]|jgi:ATP-binding cassette subfamily B protein|nr:ABC transporter ATP-binding protein [candidate division NC10 bacterium]MCH7897011.1 ABC transporter ATP-binding protein [candidate division NC10 bacterium]MCZ6551733.1 ABC transporter ATP-binding protein [candidate division NC10 bacterium]